jgi:multiple sugar transport system substrate-binding protein
MKMKDDKMKLSRREFLVLGGKGAALAVLITSCGPTPQPTSPPAEIPQEQPEPTPVPVKVAGTINFLAWGDPADLPAWDKIVEMYKTVNPDVKVERTDVSDPNANFYPKLQTMIAGGTPPHVSSFQGWEWQTYADKDILAPIDDYVARDGFTAPFPDLATIDLSTKRGGKRYLIPLQLGTMVMFYAKKHFDEAGIPYPSEDWTMDEFIEIAKQLTDTSGSAKKFGLQANGNWFRDIAYIRATGKREFDELVDPKKAQFNQPEIVDMLQLMAFDVYHTLKISPTAADLEGGANTIETGNCAMKYEGAWFFPRLNSPELREQEAQVEFDVVLMPIGADANRPHRGWAEGVALPKSNNVDAAWDFAKFMAGEEGDKIYSETTGRIPNSFDLINNFWIPTIQERFGVQNGQAFLQAFQRSQIDVVGGVPRSKMWGEVVKPFGYDPMVGGSAKAAEVLPKVDTELQKLLDDYWASL